jgi:hypothetical protein
MDLQGHKMFERAGPRCRSAQHRPQSGRGDPGENLQPLAAARKRFMMSSIARGDGKYVISAVPDK